MTLRAPERYAIDTSGISIAYQHAATAKYGMVPFFAALELFSNSETIPGGSEPSSNAPIMMPAGYEHKRALVGTQRHCGSVMAVDVARTARWGGRRLNRPNSRGFHFSPDVG